MKKVYIALIALSALLMGVFGTLFVNDAFFSASSVFAVIAVEKRSVFGFGCGAVTVIR